MFEINKVITQAMSQNLLSYAFTSLNPFLEDEIYSSRSKTLEGKNLEAKYSRKNLAFPSSRFSVLEFDFFTSRMKYLEAYLQPPRVPRTRKNTLEFSCPRGRFATSRKK